MGTIRTGPDDAAVPRRVVLLGLGSNLGDRLAHLRAAVTALAGLDGVNEVVCSRVYESPPMGPVPQGHYLNAVVRLVTTLSPREMLQAALGIESERGRVRRVKWGPRTLDIDVLWVEGLTVDEPGLCVPHPGLAQRAFVLRPVAEVMPELHLSDGRTAAEAAKGLSDDACVPLQGTDLRR